MRIQSIEQAYLLYRLSYYRGCDMYMNICTKTYNDGRYVEIVGDVNTLQRGLCSDRYHDYFPQPKAIDVASFLIYKFDAEFIITPKFTQVNFLGKSILSDNIDTGIEHSIGQAVLRTLDFLVKLFNVKIIVYKTKECEGVEYRIDENILSTYLK